MKIKEILAKSALVKSNLPFADYVINPYTGCAFGCVYCYADFMRRFSGHTNDKWGEFVDIKINIPDLLDKELPKLIDKINKKRSESKTRVNWPSVFLGSVTDPYQGMEAKYKLTRNCLIIINKNNYKGKVSLLTKSTLVKRDIDIFKKMKNLTLGITVTSTNNKVSRLLERNAPPASLRLRTLSKLNSAGIQTYAFVGPLLPYFVDSEKSLKELFQEIENTGTKEIWIEFLNLTGPIRKRIKDRLKGKVNRKILYQLLNTTDIEYKSKLSQMILNILKKTNLKLWDKQVLDHKKYMNWK